MNARELRKKMMLEKKADQKAGYKCKANHQGSAAAMETEGVKRIFNRSEKT